MWKTFSPSFDRARIRKSDRKKMTHHFHSVVSIDHAQAVIFEFSADDVSEHRIKATDRQGNIHHKAGSVGSGHAHDSKSYLTAVVSALKPSHEILIVGHGTAKDELASFIRDHAPLLAPRIWVSKPWINPPKAKFWHSHENSSRAKTSRRRRSSAIFTPDPRRSGHAYGEKAAKGL
jgi:hypothetical protein